MNVKRSWIIATKKEKNVLPNVSMRRVITVVSVQKATEMLLETARSASVNVHDNSLSPRICYVVNLSNYKSK